MTEEVQAAAPVASTITTATSPTPSTAVTPAVTPSPAATPNPAPVTTPSTPDAYRVPDAYKEKPWASKIKSEDDLYKQIDNLTGLVGKKHLVPDFTKATPAELEEYYGFIRPADKGEYKFSETSAPEVTGKIADILHKNGITAHQGNAVIAEYQALEQAGLAAATSADGFKEVMTKSFGEKYDGMVASVVAEHKQHLSADDQALMDSMPNDYLGAVYRLTQKMKEAYGAKETGAQVEGKTGAPAVKDVEVERKELRAQLKDVAARPHTEAELQTLKDKLHSTYESKKRA